MYDKSSDDEDWTPRQEKTKGRRGRRTSKNKSTPTRKDVTVNYDPLDNNSDEEDDVDDMLLLMKKLEEMKKRKKRKLESKQQARFDRHINETLKSLKDVIAKHKTNAEKKRNVQYKKRRQHFNTIQTDLKDWYSQFSTLHDEYMKDMSTLNRQFTRQCKRFDDAISECTSSNDGVTEEIDAMKIKISSAMDEMKKNLLRTVETNQYGMLPLYVSGMTKK